MSSRAILPKLGIEGDFYPIRDLAEVRSKGNFLGNIALTTVLFHINSNGKEVYHFDRDNPVMVEVFFLDEGLGWEKVRFEALTMMAQGITDRRFKHPRHARIKLELKIIGPVIWEAAA